MGRKRTDTGRRVKKESLRNREAFDFYYALGPGRNIDQVAEKFGVTRKTIGVWSVSFNWQERVAQRDIATGEELERHTNETILDAKAAHRKMIRDLLDKFMQKFAVGDIEPKNIKDAERLIKLDLLLMGEPTERDDGRMKIQIRVGDEEL